MEELINKRFEEHRTRQSLPSSTGVMMVESAELDIEFVVDTGDEHEEEEGHPTPTSYTKISEDKSRKGSVDARIRSLVTLINSTNDFFTTSTCSGRFILFTNESVEVETSSQVGPSTVVSPVLKKIKKAGCQWLMVSHDEVSVQEFLDAWRKAVTTVNGDVTFKVEAAILHIQARKLSDAKKLVHAATESGFRNSGMVIGKENRITVAVRSALGFEVPLTTINSTTDSYPTVSDVYLTYLIEKGNEKMVENWRRLEKFRQEFTKMFIS